MTHADLILRAERWLMNTMGCGFVLTELKSLTNETPDAIGWKFARSYLVECKVSRADFLGDRKKSFRINPWQGMGNFRYFMTLPDVAHAKDLPEKWGLLWVRDKRVEVVKKAEGFLEHEISSNERVILCSALRRLRGDLKKIKEWPMNGSEKPKS